MPAALLAGILLTVAVCANLLLPAALALFAKGVLLVAIVICFG